MPKPSYSAKPRHISHTLNLPKRLFKSVLASFLSFVKRHFTHPFHHHNMLCPLLTMQIFSLYCPFFTVSYITHSGYKLFTQSVLTYWTETWTVKADFPLFHAWTSQQLINYIICMSLGMKDTPLMFSVEVEMGHYYCTQDLHN